MNREELLKALDNNNNKNIINLSKEKINKDKINIINQLYLDNVDKKNILNKLSDYIYVDDLEYIKTGSYVRWINLSNHKSTILTNGGLICDIKYLDDGCHLVCKNSYNRFMQLNMESNLIFQKLNNQEKVLLSVIDYLNK